MELVFLVFAFVLFVLACTDMVTDVTNKVRCVAAGLAFMVATQIFLGSAKYWK